MKHIKITRLPLTLDQSLYVCVPLESANSREIRRIFLEYRPVIQGNEATVLNACLLLCKVR